jgi:O-antigen/teichoic acid export membrane protein
VESVGLVAWSFNTASIIGLRLPQLAGKVFTGASNKLRDSREDFTRYFEQTLFVCTVVVGTALGVLAATMPELLFFLFKPGWHNAASFFVIASAAMGFGILYSLYDAQMVVLGYPVTAAKATWAWAVTLFASGFALAKILGPSGLLWGHLLGNLAPILILHAKARAVCPVEVKKNFLMPLLG